MACCIAAPTVIDSRADHQDTMKETIVRLRDVGTDNIATEPAPPAVADAATDTQGDTADRARDKQLGTEDKKRDDARKDILKNQAVVEVEKDVDNEKERTRLKTFVKHLTMSSSAVPPLTTHVLDTSTGYPAANVPMVLSVKNSTGVFNQLEQSSTNSDGRGGFLHDSGWQPGVYRLHFDTDAYFRQQNTTGFYPYVEVVFRIDGPKQHYHVPLLLSPYGYSTYRGS